MTAFAVPANQTVSLTVYRQAVQNALPVPYNFLKQNDVRIERAFTYGEPIHMIVEELKMLWGMGTYRSKTPGQLAARRVRIP